MRLQGLLVNDRFMDKRPTRSGKAANLRPLDHLRPGEHPLSDRRAAAPPPADPDPGAASGKDTPSPAATETREHLEGSEQGPA